MIKKAQPKKKTLKKEDVINVATLKKKTAQFTTDDEQDEQPLGS